MRIAIRALLVFRVAKSVISNDNNRSRSLEKNYGLNDIKSSTSWGDNSNNNIGSTSGKTCELSDRN